MKRYRYLIGISIIIQIFFMMMPISFEADGGQYYKTARFFMDKDDGVFTFVRPPGFPVFLIATGQIWPESFKGTLVAHAVMNTAGPVLVAATISTVAPTIGLAAGFIWMASLIPFSYTQLMLAENLYLFLLLLGAYCFARFVKDSDRRFAAGAIFAFWAAGMTRTEALPLLLFMMAFMLTRTSWKTVVVSGLACLALTLAWSYQRSVLLEQPELFGSLNNFSGHQLFGRAFLPIGNAISGRAVRPDNGPASERLNEFLKPHLAELSYKTELKAGATQEETLKNLYACACHNLSWEIGEIARRELGLLKGDKMLRDVAIETFIAQPESFRVMLDDAKKFIAPSWGEDSYTSFSFNQGGSAKHYLSEAMFVRYLKNHNMRRPNFLYPLRSFANTTHNAARAVIAPLFLILAVLGLLHHFRLAGFITGVAVLLVAAPAISVGWSMRYEHVTIPFMLMSASLGFSSLSSTFRRLRKNSSAGSG